MLVLWWRVCVCSRRRSSSISCSYLCFCFNDTATTEIYPYSHTLSLHDALPISLTMAELQSFLRNPARGFLRGRLDIVLPYRDDARGGDREPQGDNALLRHPVVSTLLQGERDDAALRRSEEGRRGKEGVSTCRTRGPPDH